MKHYYGAFVMQPLPARDSLNQVIEYHEKHNVCLFEDLHFALQYITHTAHKNSMRAHTVPLGPELNQYLTLPGVGMLYRLSATTSVQRNLQFASEDERAQGICYVGSIDGAIIHEKKGVLIQDDFVHTPIEVCEINELPAAINDRIANYVLLDDILKTTPTHVLSQFTPQSLTPKKLAFSLGPQAPMHHNFRTDCPQDDNFWNIHKMLYEHSAGLRYVVDLTPKMYNMYRDVYTQHVIAGTDADVATVKAADEILNKLIEIAQQNHDTDALNILQEAAEHNTVEFDEPVEI